MRGRLNYMNSWKNFAQTLRVTEGRGCVSISGGGFWRAPPIGPRMAEGPSRLRRVTLPPVPRCTVARVRVKRGLAGFRVPGSGNATGYRLAVPPDLTYVFASWGSRAAR